MAKSIPVRKHVKLLSNERRSFKGVELKVGQKGEWKTSHPGWKHGHQWLTEEHAKCSRVKLHTLIIMNWTSDQYANPDKQRDSTGIYLTWDLKIQSNGRNAFGFGLSNAAALIQRNRVPLKHTGTTGCFHHSKNLIFLTNQPPDLIISSKTIYQQHQNCRTRTISGKCQDDDIFL